MVRDRFAPDSQEIELMKGSKGLIVFIAAVLAFLFVLSLSTKIPLVPSDAVHSGIVTNAGCEACHGPGKQAPLKPTHPPKEQCLTCHKRK
jgi:hypothetical protein